MSLYLLSFACGFLSMLSLVLLCKYINFAQAIRQDLLAQVPLVLKNETTFEKDVINIKVFACVKG